MSKTEINYNAKEASLQMTVHLFIDDLELGLKEYTSEPMNLFNNNESIVSDSMVALYILEKLQIKLDGKTISPIYIGKEISDDLAGAWCYLEVENTEPFKKISVDNALLTSVYDDQKNIINIKVNNKTKAFHILDKKDSFKDIEL
ncbi:MAG: hypothetical protein HKO66_11815 [Saprospiraceae bacterium]|nr:hypothetical protein [Bacteroidia bacterium]NNL92915.1 hypothetical protein [Saprospiraceae bacterium]